MKNEAAKRRFLVADDHPLYLEAVCGRLQRLFPGAEIVELASLDDLTAFGGGGSDRFDLVLIDLRMPGMNGPASVTRVIERFPDVPVVIMSGAASANDVRAAIVAGARGFFPKTMSPEWFSGALNIVLAGGSYLPTDILTGLLPQSGAPETTQIPDRLIDERARASIATLTPREREVLTRVAAGLSNKEIALELAIAEITVKLHVRQILRKVQARNRSAAAAIATKAGLL